MTVACANDGAASAASGLTPHRFGVWQGSPVYAIYQAPDGRLMLYARGTVRELVTGDAVDEQALPLPLRRH